MDEKQLQFLYNEYAKNKGFKDYFEFKGLMSSEGSRKLFFDDANKELGFKDYSEFNDFFGLKKKFLEKYLLLQNCHQNLSSLLKKVLALISPKKKV